VPILIAIKVWLADRRILPPQSGCTIMLQYLEFESVRETPASARGADGFVALIQKLRWMGLDEEAEELFTGFGDDWPPQALVSTIPDTD
jgi:hypothetical protein